MHDDERTTRPAETAADSRGDEDPDKPTALPRSAWGGVLKRTVREFKEDNLTDWAAALTYYGVLSIFPALVAIVSVVGLIGQSATGPLLENIQSFTPGPARDIVRTAIEGLAESRGGAGLLFVVGLAGALWSASGYVGAFMRASNAVWDVEEGRPIWKTLPLRVGVTIVMLVLLAASALAVVLTGALADRVGKLIGIGSTFVTVWDIAKWPVLVLLVSFMFAFLYYVSPNVRQPSFRWVTPGGIVAVLVWIAVSAAFALYVAAFGSYNKTYGSLGAVIVFLVWLWLSNVAILLGAELNAEVERGRQVEKGHPVDEEPFLPPRDEPR